MDEDDFKRRQALAKAQYRARESRVHPVDVVLMNLSVQTDECFVVEDVEMFSTAVEQVDFEELRPFLKSFDDSVREYIQLIKEYQNLSSKKCTIDVDIQAHLQSLSETELHSTLQMVMERSSGRCSDDEYWRGVECQVRKLMTVGLLKKSFFRLLSKRRQSCQNCNVITSAHLIKPVEEQTDTPIRDRWTFMLSRWTRPSLDSDPLEAIVVSPQLVVPEYSARQLMHIKWTRMNERRHDAMNPPPRLCSGLVVLVNYRELSETEIPEYELTTTDDGDCRWLVIKAPRLYSDLQFKIPNCPWDCSPKHGFRFSFDHGILLLHVRFKR